MTSDESRAMHAAHEGIPLACAGEIGFTMGGTRWLRMGSHWFYEGMPPWMVDGCNTTLVAVPEAGMSSEEFGRLWRGVVRDLMRVARCVRVRVCERSEHV